MVVDQVGLDDLVSSGALDAAGVEKTAGAKAHISNDLRLAKCVFTLRANSGESGEGRSSWNGVHSAGYRCARRTMGSWCGPRRADAETRGNCTRPERGKRGTPVSTVTLNKRVQDFVITRRQLFINGQLVDAKSGKTFDTVNPATGEEFAAVSDASLGDAADALDAASAAQETAA